MNLVAKLTSSGRFGFRFLCTAWLTGSIELLRRWAPPDWPPERHVVALIFAFGVSALLGGILLWRTRATAAREIVESSAMLGFWVGVFALLV